MIASIDDRKGGGVKLPFILLPYTAKRLRGELSRFFSQSQMFSNELWPCRLTM